MISHRDQNNFSILTNQQSKEIDLLSHVLFFLGLEKMAKRGFDEKTNGGTQILNWCTSDNFLVLHQNFDPNSDWLAPSSGAIHTIKDCGKVSEMIFTTPGYINSHYELEYNRDFYPAMKKCFKRRRSPELRRVLATLEWLYHAYKNTTDISAGSRIIMLATAFEALLEISFVHNKKKKEFGNKIEFVSKLLEDQIISFVKHGDNPNNGKETGTKKMQWAYRFYELRNKIVHGEIVKSREYLFSGMQHFRIAELFLVHAVKQILSAIPELVYRNYDQIACRSCPPFVSIDGAWEKIRVQVFNK